MAIPMPLFTLRDLVALYIPSATGFADPLDLADYRILFIDILQVYAQHALLLVGNDLIVLDEPFRSRTLATLTFILDEGMSTFCSFAILPFLILVSISAIGSVIAHRILLLYTFIRCYQLDLITPGISPFEASFLRQILHMSNFR